MLALSSHYTPSINPATLTKIFSKFCLQNQIQRDLVSKKFSFLAPDKDLFLAETLFRVFSSSWNPESEREEILTLLT